MEGRGRRRKGKVGEDTREGEKGGGVVKATELGNAAESS